jgi:hypothetical protein
MSKNSASVADRYARLVDRLRQAVFGSSATTEQATRSAAATGGRLSEPFGSYAAKVRDESYRITDSDVAALKEAGHTEDEIFEITVSAAVGAALRSLEAGLRAVSSQD